MTLPIIFYLLTIVLSGILTGFMVSYCLTLGHYFSYLATQQKIDQIQPTYAAFRSKHRAKLWYVCWMIGQFFIAGLTLLLHSNYPPAGQLFALAAFPLLILLRALTGFAQVEEKMFSGAQLSAAELQHFVRCNLPLHRLYALLYGTATILLLLGMIW